jgi:uncharacterized membrane protein (DUF106 family)
MGKILAKTLIAIVIGLTVGLITGYTINTTRYYMYGAETTKDIRDREINKKLMEMKREGNTTQEIEDYKQIAIIQTTYTIFNKKVGLLSGSITASIIIILLLGSELKKKKE